MSKIDGHGQVVQIALGRPYLASRQFAHSGNQARREIPATPDSQSQFSIGDTQYFNSRLLFGLALLYQPENLLAFIEEIISGQHPAQIMKHGTDHHFFCIADIVSDR